MQLLYELNSINKEISLAINWHSKKKKIIKKEVSSFFRVLIAKC